MRNLTLTAALLTILCVISGCQDSYTEQELRNIHNECKEQGNIAGYYWNSHEDMNVSRASEKCKELPNVYDQIRCVGRNRNHTLHLEAVSCFEPGKGETLYGNCSYARKQLIDEGYYLLADLADCRGE